MEEALFQHFRPEEKTFVEQVVDWMDRVQVQNRIVLTDFLNPREVFIVKSLIGKNKEIVFGFSGGYEESESQRGLLIPESFYMEADTFDLQWIEIDYPDKFSSLKHGQILGSLLGSGIKRDRIGDIITDGERWQFVTEENMADYLIQNVKQIGRTSVKLKKIEDKDVLKPQEAWQEVNTSVSSLRADVVLSSGFNLARQKVKEAIESGKVKLNFAQIDHADHLLSNGDILSLRGKGRLRLDVIQQETKKGKIRVQLSRLNSH